MNVILDHCLCTPPVNVRVASDSFAAHCDTCGGAFALVKTP